MDDKPYVHASISGSKLFCVWLAVMIVSCLAHFLTGIRVLPAADVIAGIAISFVAVLFSNPVKIVGIPSLPTVSRYPGAPKNYCDWMRLRSRVTAHIRKTYPCANENDMYSVLAAVEREFERDPV